MKKITVLLFTLLGLAIYFYINQDNDPTQPEKKQTQKTNVVSQKAKPEVKEFDREAWQKEHDAEMARYESQWDMYKAGKTIEPLKTQVSYLQAYRDYDYYEHCIGPIGYILYGEDPVQGVFTGYMNLEYDSLSEQQKQAIEQRIKRCDSLTTFPDNVYYAQSPQVELKKRMEAILPKSQQEKDLFEVLADIERFKRLDGELAALKEGRHIDAQLYFEIRNQRNQLESQYPPQISLFGGYTDENQLIVDQLNEQIKQLDAQIVANKFFDAEKTKVTEQQLEEQKLTIQQHLMQTTSPDALLALFKLLNDSLYDESLLTVKQYLYQKLKVKPRQYQEFMVPILVTMKACSLGYPCGADSTLAEIKCLDFMKNTAADACQNDVVSYFVNNRLSPLQAADIENMLNRWN
jgi:hypothetical protein